MAKAPRPFQPVAATGNELRSGDVVFRTAAGEWLRDVSRADVAVDAQDAERLKAAMDADAAANIIVDPALIAVTKSDSGVRPLALREIIRANGPTVALPGNG
jgi:hypothetical protein